MYSNIYLFYRGGGTGSGGSNSGDELKTQFMTREGTYRLMTLSEYSRPNRVGYANAAANTSAPVKVSFFPSGASSSGAPGPEGGEKIAFNYGRELFVYPYKGNNSEGYAKLDFLTYFLGVRKAADLTKPIDKRVYKGTCPTCHDFGPPGCLKNEQVRSVHYSGKRYSLSVQAEVTPLLVGFSGGQIQLIDPVRKELSRYVDIRRMQDLSLLVTCQVIQ